MCFGQVHTNQRVVLLLQKSLSPLPTEITKVNSFAFPTKFFCLFLTRGGLLSGYSIPQKNPDPENKKNPEITLKVFNP